MKEKEAHAYVPKFPPRIYCGARSKQNNHRPCRQPAMKNGRCRLHGGKSPIKHGLYTKQAMKEKRQLRAFMKQAEFTF